jgi:L-ascorbate 6-phosphate lactonase
VNFIATLLAAGIASAAAAGAVPGAGELASRLRAESGLAVAWVGNTGWLIKSGATLIGIDPDLFSAERIEAPPITAEELAREIHIVFITHHHGDHCNIPTLRALARGGNCTFVLPKTCLKRVADLAIPTDRIVVPTPGQPFEVRGIRVEPLHAIHGNQEFTVLTREPDFVESIASNCGYVFNLQGKRLFHPGDSVLTEEHLALRNIDVLFISPTVHNMYLDRSTILINRLEPAYIFPQHFGTYRQTEENAFWTRGYPDELKQRLSGELRKRYHKLAPGEIFAIR